jgi:hypothetical protein
MRRVAMSARLERGVLIARQPEGIGQQSHCLFVRSTADATFDVADAAGAHAGPFGKLLLSQPGSNSVPPQQFSQGIRGASYHADSLTWTLTAWSSRGTVRAWVPPGNNSTQGIRFSPGFRRQFFLPFCHFFCQFFVAIIPSTRYAVGYVVVLSPG